MSTSLFPGQIAVPTMVVDEEKARRNIASMRNHILAAGATFRPHFKTHQSLEIGRWFLEAGIDKITVSSPEMAAYFAADGWKNITIAFPVNLRQISLINELSGKINLHLVAEDPMVIRSLNEKIENPAGIWLKIDTGYHRTGIFWNDEALIEQCLKVLPTNNKLMFNGFLSHSGHTYQATNKAQVLEIHNQSRNRMLSLAKRFRDKYPNLMLSMGDTPTCSIADDLTGISEWRPGNFVFYDLFQQSIGSCEYDEISAIVVCPVVAVHPERKEAVLYGGAVHFSKEQLSRDGKTIYGKVLSLTGKGWEIEPVEADIIGLTQEHGRVKFRYTRDINRLRPGSLLGFYPVHSCLTANLLRGYLTTTGKAIDHLSGLQKKIY